MTTPGIQRRWKALPGEPVGDAGDAYIGYDRFGRTEAMRWIKPLDGGFDTLVNVQWGYSPASQKTWRKDLLAPASTGQDQKFNYDALYQVTERQRGVLNVNATAASGIPAQQENFSYDETGNWKAYKQSNDGTLGIDQSRVNNKSNQITQVDGSSAGITYDPNGNMLTVQTGEDLTGPSRRIVWDAWNRPVRVYDADDNLIAEYQYDGVGRRVTDTSGGSTRHTYYDDQWRSVEDRIDGATTAEKQHVWQPNNRWEMILRDSSTTNNGTMDERLYPMKDQLDPVAICEASGNVVERYAYTAFGLPTFLDVLFSPQSSSFAWNFLFHAEFQDAETGWFNYGYRFYIPTLGRWPSRDPIAERGGLNLYGMVGNDAVDRIDRRGLSEWKINPTDERHDLGAYNDPASGETYPGGGVWNIPRDDGTIAVTVAEWDASAKCKCKDGKWWLNYVKVSLTPVVRYRTSYSSAATAAYVRKGEQDHVADLKWWARHEGKSTADQYEKSHYGDSYADQATCESQQKTGLEAALRPSIAAEMRQTIADYDDSGLHYLPQNLTP